MKQMSTSILLAGAAPDTGNHGVTALAHSLLIGMQERGLERFTIFDHGHGASPFGGSEPATAGITCVAFKAGKRVYEGANMHQARLKQLMGFSSPALRAMQNANAVVDVSGGDSFTDLYGPARFDQITLPKLMALDAGVPLILLPQTFGPFRFKRSRRIARHILNSCTLAFARDVDSHAYLKELLGAEFDEQRHRLGVDLAFGLPSVAPANQVSSGAVGINVSGLLWNRVEDAATQFGLACDYRQTLMQLVRHILTQTNLHVLLVPHVTPAGGSESDLVASRALKQAMPDHLRSRMDIEEVADTPAKLKGVISETEWFVGARMHATIAALSSGTPVANMAYSRKARGVFDCCGAADHVYDMRKMSTRALVKGLIADFENRHQHALVLKSQIPFVKRRWAYQMDVISAAAKNARPASEAAYA